MRHPIALFSVLTVACTAVPQASSEAPTFDPGDTIGTLSCEPRSLGFDPPASVERLIAASDSSILLVYQDAREVVVASPDLALTQSLRLEREGPTGVATLQDAALIDDTLFVVADGPRRMLRAFTPKGEPRWVVDLPVMPDRIIATTQGVVVFPLVLAGIPVGGAYLVRDGAAHDLGVETVSLDDPQMSMLANLVSPTVARGTSRVVVPRQFIAPVVAVIDLAGEDTPRELAMPLAKATAPRAWWAPAPPYSEAEIERIIAPAMSTTGGPGPGEISVLTRSGARRGEYLEKVIVRLDPSLAVLAAWTVPFNAVHVVWLASEQAYYIVTAEETWYRCSLPFPLTLTDAP